MASRSSTFIELSDIVSFNLACSKCHYSVTIPRTTSEKTKEILKATPLKCPNCGGEQVSRDGTEALLNLERELANIEGAVSKTNLLFSLEIRQEVLELLAPRVTIKAA